MNELQLEITKLIGKKDFGIGLLFKQAYTDKIETMTSEVRGGNFYSTIGGIPHFPHTSQITEIIGHPATLTDLLEYIDKTHDWKLTRNWIRIDEYTNRFGHDEYRINIPYDSSKELLEQSDETLTQILALIQSWDDSTQATHWQPPPQPPQS